MSLDTLTFGEFVVLVIVIIELTVVAFAVAMLIFLRRSAINREDEYEHARQRLSELMPDLVGEKRDEAMAGARRLVNELGKDHARRLLTELAEFVTIDHAAALAELFEVTGLAAESRASARARPWERLRVIREARALADPANLLSDLIKDEDADVRIAAFEALCALGRADEALVAIRRVANDGRLARTRAVDSLAMTDPLPLQQLINLASADQGEVRLMMVGALGRSGVREASDVLIHAVTDEDVEVRIEALRALKELEDRSALPACLAALKDEFWEVRSAAVGTCAALGREGAAAQIALLLDDTAEWVRHNASLALGRCGAAGLAALRQAAARGNENASSALAERRLATEGS